jgi:hypothetical protein
MSSALLDCSCSSGSVEDQGKVLQWSVLNIITSLNLIFCDNKLEANANDKDLRPELCSGNQQK